MRQTLVGVSGFAGAGKDYVADILIEKTKRHARVVKVPWAQGVRDEILAELGIQLPRQAPDLYAKPTSPAVRRLLQWWGTEFRRAEDPEYWIKWGLRSAQRSRADVVFFTDTRFQNEVDAITTVGGIIINVTASEKARVDRIGVTPKHASEDLAAYLPFDVRINNEIGEPNTDLAYAMIRAIVRGEL
ncbi:hypothetical protein LCGC14_1942340 [marine sediment metagenome]|uniref:Deoxynucleotide monophosphate kinase n=1 Tax=marine sediment metagenome TaxID=412755 RepID=A0A0F9IH29_9ZZZZ